MQIETPRFRLRDFLEDDRQCFVDYQMDPRYRNLYDFADSDATRANQLFNLFSDWREQDPRQNYQLGVFERRNSQLCGCAGLRQSGQPEGWQFLVWSCHPIIGDDLGWPSKSRLRCWNTAFPFSTSTRLSVPPRVATAVWHGSLTGSAQTIVDYRDGPEWMKARGWKEVGWATSHSAWKILRGRRRCLKTN